MPTPKLTLPKFIEKAKTIHGELYDYSLVTDPFTRSYSDFICKIHGPFHQRNSAHLLGQGCKKCRDSSVGARFRFTKEDFIKDARNIHGDLYNYDKFVYTTDKTPSTITCIKHNLDFLQTPCNHKNCKFPCPKCSKKSIN